MFQQSRWSRSDRRRDKIQSLLGQRSDTSVVANPFVTPAPPARPEVHITKSEKDTLLTVCGLRDRMREKYQRHRRPNTSSQQTRGSRSSSVVSSSAMIEGQNANSSRPTTQQTERTSTYSPRGGAVSTRRASRQQNAKPNEEDAQVEGGHKALSSSAMIVIEKPVTPSAIRQRLLLDDQTATKRTSGGRKRSTSFRKSDDPKSGSPMLVVNDASYSKLSNNSHTKQQQESLSLLPHVHSTVTSRRLSVESDSGGPCNRSTTINNMDGSFSFTALNNGKEEGEKTTSGKIVIEDANADVSTSFMANSGRRHRASVVGSSAGKQPNDPSPSQQRRQSLAATPRRRESVASLANSERHLSLSNDASPSSSTPASPREAKTPKKPPLDWIGRKYFADVYFVPSAPMLLDRRITKMTQEIQKHDPPSDLEVDIGGNCLSPTERLMLEKAALIDRRIAQERREKAIAKQKREDEAVLALSMTQRDALNLGSSVRR